MRKHKNNEVIYFEFSWNILQKKSLTYVPLQLCTFFPAVRKHVYTSKHMESKKKTVIFIIASSQNQISEGI
jgi:hypothetical protein